MQESHEERWNLNDVNFDADLLAALANQSTEIWSPFGSDEAAKALRQLLNSEESRFLTPVS